jgi:uncharacterized protein
MDPAKIPLIPVAISIFLVVIVECTAKILPLSPILATGVVRVIQIFIILGVYHRSAMGIAALGMGACRIKHGIIQGVLWSVVFGMTAGCLGVALMIFGINPLRLINMSMPSTAQEIVVFYIVGGIIGPIAEEIFFRGMIYGHIRELFTSRYLILGVIIAMIISTLIFVLAHTESSGIPLPQLAGGIVFCLAYEKEKSLFTPMIIHCSGNMAMFTLSLI